jgi:SMODS-associating 2TM, beta-strand rich effector domain
VSNWAAPAHEASAAPIEAYVVIRQTYSSIDARLFSLEMSSASLSASIVSDAVGLHVLFVIYRSEPKVLLRAKSPIHYGGMLLSIRGDPARKLDGEYWTDRETKGSVAFLDRAKQTSYEFNDAAARFIPDPAGPSLRKSERAGQRKG